MNAEQIRAFKLIANHAASIGPEQLKMYLGGMGGTGKTQVIRALIDMFEQKKESHRFLVLAPTGTAAALLKWFHIPFSTCLRNTDAKEAGMTKSSPANLSNCAH